jgi:hypothetical protein
MHRVLLFVDAFGVFLVRCRCFLVTLLHLRGCLVVVFQHISYILSFLLCVFGWLFLASLIMFSYGLLSSICGVEVLMCVLQALSVYLLF